MSSLFETTYNPDVLSCIANLSNDEVFTPPDLANQMLDLLPTEIWGDPDATFLDPASKSGVFLREIAKRLISGLEGEFPDLQERLDHIYEHQVYGIAITELTSLLSRRSLYCSKYPNSKYSIVRFGDPEGNVRFKNVGHTWSDGRCIYCGATQKQYDRDASLESYAYEFIHTDRPEALLPMKFDVVIGNPPYQLSDGGAQASAAPIYQKFIKQAIKLNPRYLVMIIPARWYAGGRGLDEFRKDMLDDKHIEELHDFPNTEDCFPGVNIRGGVCYFKRSRSFDNTKQPTKIVTHTGHDISVSHRRMRYRNFNLFIRYSESISILEKITSQEEDTLDKHVSPLRPFGLRGYFSKDPNFRKSPYGLEHPLKCYAKSHQIGYVDESLVPSHRDWASVWKVAIPRANNIATELSDDNLNSFVLAPGEICTESFLVIGSDLHLSKEEALHLASYLRTTFVRFVHSIAKSSQDATSKTWRFVPLQDFSREWSDQDLYAKYRFSRQEIDFIQSMIKPMDGEQ